MECKTPDPAGSGGRVNMTNGRLQFSRNWTLERLDVIRAQTLVQSHRCANLPAYITSGPVSAGFPHAHHNAWGRPPPRGKDDCNTRGSPGPSCHNYGSRGGGTIRSGICHGTAKAQPLLLLLVRPGSGVRDPCSPLLWMPKCSERWAPLCYPTPTYRLAAIPAKTIVISTA